MMMMPEVCLSTSSVTMDTKKPHRNPLSILIMCLFLYFSFRRILGLILLLLFHTIWMSGGMKMQFVWSTFFWVC